MVLISIFLKNRFLASRAQFSFSLLFISLSPFAGYQELLKQVNDTASLALLTF